MLCVTTWLAASNAVMVMWFAPSVSGIEVMVQLEEPSALPISPSAVLHATSTGATPPAVMPEADIEAADVVDVAPGFCTVSVNGAGAGCVGCVGLLPAAAP